jgi:CHASE2 domain-containing sensor protein
MKKLLIQGISVTAFVFVMMWAVDKVTDFKIFTAFDTISQSLKETELTDYAFNSLRETPTVDERIVLVNFSNLSRGEIAQQIQTISAQKPRVIALDALFNCEGGLYDTLNCPQLLDSLGNMMLRFAIQESGRVVLGEKLMQTDSLGKFDSNEADSIEKPDPNFAEFVHLGFVNLPTDATYQEDVKVVRSIYPQRQVNGKRELAFSVRIAMMYDSVLTEKFLSRNKEEEIINFRGNIEVRQLKVTSLKDDETATTNFGTMFSVIDADGLATGQFSDDFFKDKIVIVGYLGDYIGHAAWEDKFFTPMNKKFGGRANPDMFGPVVHANAVAMILNQDYVDELEEWQQFAIAIIVCFLTIILFIIIDEKLPIWYDALSVIIQLVQLAIIMAIVVYVFAESSLKLDLSLTFVATALVGPCYDIFKSVQNQMELWLTKRKNKVLTTA